MTLQRSSHMADPQDQPAGNGDSVPSGPDPAAGSPEPAEQAGAPGEKKTERAQKATKKTPAQKTPAKKATKKTPAKKAAQKTPAKKATKKTPAKKAPARKPAEPERRQTAGAAPAADLTSAAEEVAAHAKSTVASAPNPVATPAPISRPDDSRLPFMIAVASGALILLIVLLVNRRGK